MDVRRHGAARSIGILLAMCVGVAGLLAPGSAWAAPATSLAFSTTSVLPGETLTLTGVAPGGSRPVQVQRKVKKSWKVVGRVRSDAGGAYAWSTAAAGRMTFRAVAPKAKVGGKRLKAAASAARTITVENNSAAITTGLAYYGVTTDNIHGDFWPRRPGRPVALQTQTAAGAPWTTIETKQQDAGGHVGFRWIPPGGGQARIRLYAAAWLGGRDYAHFPVLVDSPQKPPPPPVRPSEPPLPAGTASLSLLPDGRSAAYAQEPSVSRDGRWVAFRASTHAHEQPWDGGQWQVWLRDTTTDTTRLVSRAASGSPAQAATYGGEVSADGRFVFYLTRDPALTGLDAGATHLLRYDVATGQTTRLSSATMAGHRVLGIEGVSPSADGQRSVVLAEVEGTDPDAEAEYRLLLLDAVAGASDVAVPDELYAPGAVGWPRLSGNGRFVVYEGLHEPVDGSRAGQDVYRTDLATGTVELVSALPSGGTSVGGDRDSESPSISHDGSRVGFASSASNLGTGSQYGYRFYVRDFAAGALRLMPQPEGARFIGTEILDSTAISADGRSLAAVSPTLTTTNGQSPHRVLYVYDVDSGAVRATVSKSPQTYTDDFGFPRLTGNGAALLYADRDQVMRRVVG